MNYEILPGMLFFHYRNKHTYIILDKCLIQVNDEWLDGIIYTDLNDNNIVKKFVRTEEEFKEKFQRFPSNDNI